MFTVDEATASAIRQAYEEGGELAGAVELSRHFPLLTHNAASRCARVIAGWQPIPEQALPKATQRRRPAPRAREGGPG
jgi:hypothetical protein